MNKITMTEFLYREFQNDHAGVCVKCNAVNFEVEPDACGYECEDCGKFAVYGIEQLMVCGKIDLTEDDSKVTLKF